ncbi:MAG: hypothetical protein HeimC3_31770 [Candidatus Heimdallarchaeota archaeon LC_3]|nr:MAG: hypothetical protein HeimC3_31770 [Candidatus Heimdallarchaeota archaeon LC_3]
MVRSDLPNIDYLSVQIKYLLDDVLVWSIVEIVADIYVFRLVCGPIISKNFQIHRMSKSFNILFPIRSVQNIYFVKQLDFA